MHLCDEETAVFMAASLTKHARSIRNYAYAYCTPNAGNAHIGEKERLTFVRNLERMLKEMYALMLMAKYKGVNRCCNVEQIEAYMEAAAAVIAPPAEAALPRGCMN